MPETSVGVPEVRQWTLRNKRSSETRQFEQSELTIEGETRLLAIVHEIVTSVDDFPWEKIPPLFDEDRPIDWAVVIDLLGLVSKQLPDAIADVTCVFLGIYPTHEDGSADPEYDVTKRFIRGAIKLTDVVEMVRTFTQQNDYQRLADPIGAILGRAAAPRVAPPTTTPPTTTITPGISNGDDASAAS